MAFSFTQSVGDGTTVSYPFSFVGEGKGYLRDSDIKVFLDDVESTYTLIGTNTIQFNTAPSVGADILIRRIMPKDKPYTDFSRGNNFGQNQLNFTVLQQLYIYHEILDGFSDGVTDHQFQADINMNGHTIRNMAAPVGDGDAVPLQFLREFVIDEQGGLALVNRAETAAISAETSANHAEDLYNDFRDDYMGNGPVFPVPNKAGSLFYYDGPDFTQGLYISYPQNNDQYTGTWSLISGVGPQGATGPQGVQGSDGVKGEQGIEGPQGIQGQQGIQGALGDTGPSGIKGETGATGPQGVQGVVGPVGAVGGQGPTGAEGPVGPAGIQGVVGPVGNTGDTGPQGQTGPTGPQGIEGPEGIVGPVGSRGPQGHQGVEGAQGNTGATGEQGIQGVGIQGAVGPQGDEGPQGVQGPIGPQGVGLQGVEGPEGPEGPDGPQGVQGISITGPTGPQGVQGPLGPRGIQGIDGQSFNIDAIGLISERVNYNNELADFKYYATDYSVTADEEPDFDRFIGNGTTTDYTLSYTADGPQSIQAQVGGVVQGPDNYDIEVVNEVYTVKFHEAPTAGLQVLVREFSIATGYGAIFIKESNTSGDWSPAIPFGRGPRGDQGIEGNQGVIGPQGATGPLGPQGPVGAQGIKGVQGSVGPQGAQGDTGPKGVQGDQGIQGTVGIQGPQGAVGAEGPEGDQGIVGSQGIAGVQGDKGDTGSTGGTGPQGPTGTVGPQGATGDVGPQGTSGPTGDTGSRGATGPQGPTGNQGSIGPEGPEGDQGPAGIVGPQGATGDVGPQGQQGKSGDRGPTGIQGAEGDRGPTGIQGPQGNLGATGPQGAQGPVGAQGARGDQGSTGPTGGVGPTGGQGPEGDEGASGRSSGGDLVSIGSVSLTSTIKTGVLKTITINETAAFRRRLIISDFEAVGNSNSINGTQVSLQLYSGAFLVASATSSPLTGNGDKERIGSFALSIEAGAVGTYTLKAQSSNGGATIRGHIRSSTFGFSSNNGIVSIMPETNETTIT